MTAPGLLYHQRHTHTAPLGLQFMDAATGQRVTAGLEVRAWPAGARRGGRTAAANRSGTWVFQDLPGLDPRPDVTSQPNPPYWDPAGRLTFRIEVVDPAGRYSPCSLEVDAPLRGVFGFVEGGSPPAGPQPIPLFPTAARSAPAAFAEVRAELFDITGNAPAPFAVLEISAAGSPLARGISDASGRVAVFFPYPRIPVSGSSPPQPPIPLVNQTWALGVAVRFVPGRSLDLPPDLLATLSQPRKVLASTTLRYGQPLVLREPNVPTNPYLRFTPV